MSVYAIVISIAWNFDVQGEIEEEKFWKVLEFERKVYHLQYAKGYVSACIKLREKEDINSKLVCERASSEYSNYSRVGEYRKSEDIKNKSYEAMLVQMDLNISQANDRIKQEKFRNKSKEIYEMLTGKVFAFGLSSFLFIVLFHLLYKSHFYSKEKN